MARTIVISVILAVFVGFLAFASDDPYNVTLPVVPVFFCVLIIVATGIIIDKINKLSEKIDRLLKDKCLCQSELSDD